jgi:hypothetical protein
MELSEKAVRRLAEQFPGVVSLDLSCNGLARLSSAGVAALGGLQLQELILDGNQLEALAPLAPLTSLVRLSARSNRLTELSRDVSCLTRLTELNLEDNKLAAGPWIPALAQLPSLQLLHLQHNPVSGELSLLASLLPRVQCPGPPERPQQGNFRMSLEAGRASGVEGSPGPRSQKLQETYEQAERRVAELEDALRLSQVRPHVPET